MRPNDVCVRHTSLKTDVGIRVRISTRRPGKICTISVNRTVVHNAVPRSFWYVRATGSTTSGYTLPPPPRVTYLHDASPAIDIEHGGTRVPGPRASRTRRGNGHGRGRTIPRWARTWTLLTRARSRGTPKTTGLSAA